MMLEIRSIAARNRKAWDNLWDSYLRFYCVDLPTEVTNATWHRLLDPLEQPHALVASIDGRTCGFAHYLFHRSTWAATNYCYLEDLFVSADQRGNGVGRALIEAVYARADEAGSSRVYWNTDATNEAARRVYDSIARLTSFVQYRR